MNTLCFIPKQEKPKFFNTGKPCVRGHVSPRYVSGACVECIKENNEKRRLSNPEKASEYQKYWRNKNRKYCNQKSVLWRFNNKAQDLVSKCKKVAKNKGLPFNLTKEDIEIPDVCPVLGIKMFFSLGKRTDNSPSVDRIIPSLGYVKGNIMIISWRANRIKCDATPEELQKLANFYKD